MRLRTVIVFCLALVFGGLAVFTARAWLEGQRNLIFNAAKKEAAPVDTIVVAARPLRFGDALQKEYLKEIPWPIGTLPSGAFRTTDEILEDGDRFVMSAIEPDEPVLGWKITGPGQRATLSAALTEGMKAITIRVNDVLGVAGFVLPGDRVDVLLTRTASDDGRSYVDVLLQGVKVLAIDQSADDRRDQPAVVKAVTFEVTTEEAQKLTLAATVGQLSLALRNLASSESEATKRVTLLDLEGSVAAELKREAATPPPAPSPAAPTIGMAPPTPVSTDPVVGVYRDLQRSEYKVKAAN